MTRLGAIAATLALLCAGCGGAGQTPAGPAAPAAAARDPHASARAVARAVEVLRANPHRARIVVNERLATARLDARTRGRLAALFPAHSSVEETIDAAGGRRIAVQLPGATLTVRVDGGRLRILAPGGAAPEPATGAQAAAIRASLRAGTDALDALPGAGTLRPIAPAARGLIHLRASPADAAIVLDLLPALRAHPQALRRPHAVVDVWLHDDGALDGWAVTATGSLDLEQLGGRGHGPRDHLAGLSVAGSFRVL